jgi:fused signal recognition particle receptor
MCGFRFKDMKKAIQEEIPSAPHETLLVVDGSVGRNAVDQANAWQKHVGVTGLVITKLDGTARG